MVNIHQYSILIESTLRSMFDCDRGGFGGLVEADSIDQAWSVSIAFGLGKLASTKEKEVTQFYEKYAYYLSMDLRELANLQSPSDQLLKEHKTGEEAIKAVIEDFSSLRK